MKNILVALTLIIFSTSAFAKAGKLKSKKLSCWNEGFKNQKY